MKKIIALLMAMAMVLSLAVCASAASVTTGINVVAEEDATGLVTVTVSAANISDFSGLKLGLDFDEAKVALLNVDKVTPATTSSTHADVVEVVDAGYAAMASHNVTIKDTYIIVNDFVSATDQWFDTTDNVLIKLYFQKNDGATLDDTSFINYYKVTAKTYYKTGTTQVLSNKAGAFGYTVVPFVPTVDEPDFSATAAGSTITCVGKVAATATNYGVEFTAESTVEGARAQKYYGAMDGDTVSDGAEGTTTFTFGDWDGSFVIVLEGVQAGSKTLNFFVDDTIIADTTFTVVAE